MAQLKLRAKCLLAALAVLLASSSALIAREQVIEEKKISIADLQDRQLKQFDLSESILDTIGQSVASGACKLSREKKSMVQLQLTTLRKAISSIKDASAVHINEKQLATLVNFNAELTRVLTGAVNSGLEVIPSFNEGALVNRSLENPSLAKIDQLLQTNQTNLEKLTQLSEKIGLNKLNKFYRDARRIYQKYYVWPIIEHTLVYTAFVHWAVFVSSSWKLEEMEDKGGLFGAIGKWASAKKKAMGSPSFPTENVYSYQGALVQAIEDKTINIDGQEKPAYRYATPPFYEHKTDPHGRTIAGKEINLDPRQIIEGTPITFTADHVIKGSNSPRGWWNAFEDPISTFVNIDHKSPLFNVPLAAWFAYYIEQDYKKIADIWKRNSNVIDDWLYGTTKKRSYDAVSTPDERFDIIVGRDDIKAELMKVVEYICSPDKFDRAGIKVERGYLLAGEPQTGKTLTAKALSGEISAALEKMGKNQKMRLFEISTENLIKKGIQYYMDLARYQAPCILFLDELDLLRLQRDGDSKLLSEFLTSMSGTLSKDEKSHVIILAATNKPENLDFALRQHGRFGKMFWFDKPTYNNRVQFFKKECEKRCMDTSRFDLTEVARQTEGCSFGTLDIVMKKALLLAKLDGTAVTQDHFERATDAEVKKLLPDGYDVPAEKEKIVATQQAGKALVSILLEPKKQLSKATVLPITQELVEEHVTQQYNIAGWQSRNQRAIRYGGIFSYNWTDALDLISQEELIKQCKILLAGNVAQTVYGLESCTYDKQDKQEAFKLAKQITFKGLDPKEVSRSVREAKLTEAYKMIEQFELEVTNLLTANKAWLERSVQALQDRKTLSVGEFLELRNK